VIAGIKEGGIAMSKNDFNYCYDECEFNAGPRHYWESSDKDGKKILGAKSEASNKKLKCSLGFSQTINSHKGLVNSIKQGSKICPRLKRLFYIDGGYI
jgi:hypothetical protein